jgi:hypothetical protein
MSILNIQTAQPTGLASVIPSLIYIETTDTYATVTTTGYLTAQKQQGFTFSNDQMALVKTSDDGVVWLKVVITYSGATIENTVVSLVQISSPGDVVLPTIANHLIVSTDVAGTLGNLTGTAINNGSIQAGLITGTAGTFISYAASANKGALILAAVANTGNTNTTLSNVAMGQASVISIPDPANAIGRLLIGATATPFVSGNFPVNSGTGGLMVDSGVPAANLIQNSVAGGQTIAASSASATPGTIRAITGAMTESNAVMTSGNVVGVRGSVTNVGASGGFIYGVQGKVISSGTLSGSSWTAGVFGQLDISTATVTAGQTACIWGDYGTTSGTITDATGMRGVAMTNTTAAVLNAQDYRYGNATYLLELAGAGGTLNYYAAAGTSAGSAGDAAHCAAQQVIKIEINGVACYIPVFTQNS